MIIIEKYKYFSPYNQGIKEFTSLYMGDFRTLQIVTLMLSLRIRIAGNVIRKQKR